MRARFEAPPQRLRVLHVAQSVAGGVASFLDELASYQARVFGASNVRFLIPSGGEAHLPGVDAAQITTFDRTSRSPAALLQFALAARAAIRRLKPDIVHAHSTFAGAVVRAGAGRRGPGVVYCPHGWAFGMETSGAKQRIYAAIERRLAARTDVILVNSQSEYDLALRFGLPARKMKVVNNGIGWAPLPERDRSTGPLRIAFIGRHDRQKGLDILLDTLRRFPLPHIHFHVIGEAVVDSAGGAGRSAPANVTFHGWMKRAEIIKFLNTVDAVVMPSRWEAFGLVAAEAMRAGVPVIASNRGALPEVIEDGVGGCIFDLDDPAALGATLQGLDRDQLMRLGRTARARWEREYVADRMNALICQAYGGVMRERAGERVQPGAAVSPEPQHLKVHAAEAGATIEGAGR